MQIVIQSFYLQVPVDDIAIIDNDPALLAASTDVDMEDDDKHIIPNTIPTEIEINENVHHISLKDTSNSPIKTAKLHLKANIEPKYLNLHDCNEEDGIPAPIEIAKP